MKITKQQNLKLIKIFKKYQLKLIVLFGSFASGKNRKDSDVDLAVLGSEKISFEKQLKLINEFSQIFEQEENSFNNNTSIQLMIRDIKIEEN